MLARKGDKTAFVEADPAMFTVRPRQQQPDRSPEGMRYPDQRLAPADVLALLSDPACAHSCLEIAEQAARSINGSMGAAHLGTRPVGMITAPEEIDLMVLREISEGSSRERFEHVSKVFRAWRRNSPERRTLPMGDYGGDMERCMAHEVHDSSIVVAPYHGNLDARDAFYDLIFNEQKLVLVPPRGGYDGSLLRHVVIAWKPQNHAQRAVTAARQWLAVAERVTIVCVNDTPAAVSQNKAKDLMAGIGIRADIVAVSSGSRSVGETILDFACAENASCLLLGAFKHSYFLELLLGRVTRYLLLNAPMPLLMKH